MIYLLTRHFDSPLGTTGGVSQGIVRFYVAELSTAIAFLHEKKIIHRSVPVLFVPSQSRSSRMSTIQRLEAGE